MNIRKQDDNTEEKVKETLKTLDKILIIVGVATGIFTIIMLVFFSIFQQIPDVLCERFFTCVVGELGATGLIQIVKTICKYKYPNLNAENLDEECLDDEFLNEEEEFEMNEIIDEGVDYCG